MHLHCLLFFKKIEKIKFNRAKLNTFPSLSVQQFIGNAPDTSPNPPIPSQHFPFSLRACAPKGEKKIEIEKLTNRTEKSVN